MNDIMNTYFGPLSRDACMYFYVLSVFCGFSFVIILITMVAYVAMNFKKIDRFYLSNGVMVALNLFLAYFVNRLLHTICMRSLV